jgi:hypothetical protein
MEQEVSLGPAKLVEVRHDKPRKTAASIVPFVAFMLAFLLFLRVSHFTDPLPTAVVGRQQLYTIQLPTFFRIARRFYLRGDIDLVRLVERRSFGLSDIARYALFTSDFIDFLRRLMPPERHAELVLSIVIVACKPTAEGVGIRAS